MMFITVFTPTYNRAHTLKKLYMSLCEQSFTDFEWLIVDDGSSDNTKELVKKWIAEKKINISYVYQNNAGKPKAHNVGTQNAIGELFVCVDSDDYLVQEALSDIHKVWNIVEKKGAIGILAFRKHSDDTPITVCKDPRIKMSALHYAYKHHGLSGDTMLIYRTDIIRKYRFPIIKGEKFIPEGYLYNKLDKEGKMYIYRKGLYVCEYLDDGYTKNVSKLIYNNYRSYVVHINARLRDIDAGFDKLLDSVRYDSVMIAHREKRIISNAVYPILAAVGYLPAIFIAYRRYSLLMKNKRYL